MISVVIPTFNEATAIRSTIKKLRIADKGGLLTEIIVSDGGSNDNTLAVAADEGAVPVKSPFKGRAAQMNYGATFAKGRTLYFLHADTVPPPGFSEDIRMTIKAGYGAGCFMLAFDHNHWFLRANCWFTRFDIDAIRFGDQSLFLTRDFFDKISGFNEKHLVLEDQDIIKRIKKETKFIVIKKPVYTSARKYLENGIYKTQGIFFIIYLMYRLGCSQQKLVYTYKRLIKQHKL